MGSTPSLGAQERLQSFDHSTVCRWLLRVHKAISSVTISSFAAIDYSDSTLEEARHLLLGLASFVEDARAYVKGQLICGPVGEDVLWER